MRGGFNAMLRIACPYATPQSPNRDGLPRSIKDLEYSLTLRTLDTNTANPVAINRYQFVRLLPARVFSVISTNCVYHLLIIFFAALLCQSQSSSLPLRSEKLFENMIR